MPQTPGTKKRLHEYRRKYLTTVSTARPPFLWQGTETTWVVQFGPAFRFEPPRMHRWLAELDLQELSPAIKIQWYGKLKKYFVY